MSARGNARGGRTGITLVELLMATAILGVVSVVVAMTLNVGVESWRTGTALADESHHADAVIEQVVMALRSAYYPEGKDANYDYGFQFQDDGESPDAKDVISWVKIGQSLIGEDVPWAGAAHRVELFVQDGISGDGPGLYVKAWQLVGQAEDFDPAEDVQPLLISDQVVSFDCRMKDPDKAEIGGEPYEWIDEWTASNRIPTHVLISIAMKPQKERDDPLVYARCVQIPMSEMSWNPIQTGSRDRDRRSRRPGVSPGGGPGGAPGGAPGIDIRRPGTGPSAPGRTPRVAPGGGVRRPGSGDFNRGGSGRPGRTDGSGGSGPDRRRPRPGSDEGSRRDFRIRSIGGGR
ncbi:MAG: PulJ/GspJ family protein [Kiritimatiellia bacterium]|jgi:hypothetical protein